MSAIVVDVLDFFCIVHEFLFVHQDIVFFEAFSFLFSFPFEVSGNGTEIIDLFPLGSVIKFHAHGSHPGDARRFLFNLFSGHLTRYPPDY